MKNNDEITRQRIWAMIVDYDKPFPPDKNELVSKTDKIILDQIHALIKTLTTYQT